MQRGDADRRSAISDSRGAAPAGLGYRWCAAEAREVVSLLGPEFHIWFWYVNQLEVIMSNKIAPQDNSSNMDNANKGTSGTNRQYDQVQGNRGKQIAESNKQGGGSTTTKGGKSK